MFTFVLFSLLWMHISCPFPLSATYEHLDMGRLTLVTLLLSAVQACLAMPSESDPAIPHYIKAMFKLDPDGHWTNRSWRKSLWYLFTTAQRKNYMRDGASKYHYCSYQGFVPEKSLTHIQFIIVNINPFSHFCFYFQITDDLSSVVVAQLLFLQSESSKKPVHMYINR